MLKERSNMKRFVLLAVLLFGVTAFADSGFFVEGNLDFLPGADGFLPALESTFGWESPRFILAEEGGAFAEFALEVSDANVFDFADNYLLDLDMDLGFGAALGVELSYGVAVDRDRLHRGQIVFDAWSALAAIQWTPTDYAEIEVGVELGDPRDATPFLRARFDF